jgi:hypothetical protein
VTDSNLHSFRGGYIYHSNGFNFHNFLFMSLNDANGLRNLELFELYVDGIALD